MIRSMTGFARATRRGEWGELTLELRSVNHRYLDLKLALPDTLRPLEEILRARLRAGLARGRVEARLHMRFGDGLRGRVPPISGEQSGSRYRYGAGTQHGHGTRLALDRALAREVIAAARELAAEMDMNAPSLPDALALLAWPGVVEAAGPPPEALAPELEALCDEALAALIGAREREGAELAAALSRRMQSLATGTEGLIARRAELEADVRTRLDERLRTLGTEVDADRVAQEAALLLVRQDVSEELDRLLAHVREAVRLLEAEAAVGRRLDFLVQELAREANTLASKAASPDVNRQALEFKVLIEEMREQVQNVE